MKYRIVNEVCTKIRRKVCLKKKSKREKRRRGVGNLDRKWKKGKRERKNVIKMERKEK